VSCSSYVTSGYRYCSGHAIGEPNCRELIAPLYPAQGQQPRPHAQDYARLREMRTATHPASFCTARTGPGCSCELSQWAASSPFRGVPRRTLGYQSSGQCVRACVIPKHIGCTARKRGCSETLLLTCIRQNEWDERGIPERHQTRTRQTA
jgi:hypothetical protein